MNNSILDIPFLIYNEEKDDQVMRILANLVFFCSVFVFLSSFALGDKLRQAQKGDYMVTKQDRTYSLLIIRDISSESILFEEISLPMAQIDPAKTSWQEWLQKGAPGHTSWVLYEIDLHTFQLIEGYSISRKGWLYLDDEHHFLSKLLSLPLQKVDDQDRKKIGPAPRDGDADRRPLWNPPLFIEGKKQKASCEAWCTRWPKDDSLLSSCNILLYFQTLHKDLVFPSWIEASNGHYHYAIHVVDTGKNLFSPLSYSMPRRPPKFLKPIQKTDQAIQIPIKSPTYYKQFSLFVFDLMHPDRQIGPIPFTLQKGISKEEFFLNVDLKELGMFLQLHHRYKWVLIPEGPSDYLIESEDFFLWPTLSPR